jgi:methylated-DNA-protein-cysteine methyltransferase-like protein
MVESGHRSKTQHLHERIYRVVRQIPAGQAATYGQVALVAGLPSARMVGRALAALPGKSEVPWHRVINSQGKLAPRSDGKPDPEQRRRLRAAARAASISPGSPGPARPGPSSKPKATTWKS